MTMQEFRDSLHYAEPPKDLSFPLAALWWDAKGNWPRAHELAQQDDGPAGAWVHAYLHRKEGDASNARYWYQRASKPQADVSLNQEWEEISASLLR